MPTNLPNAYALHRHAISNIDGLSDALATYVVSGAMIPISQVTNLQTTLDGKLAKASNLSDLVSASTARTNLGLGTAAVTNSTAYDASGAASAAQAYSIQRANHTGTQSYTTISGLGSAATTNSTAYDAAGLAASAQAFAIQRANHTGTQSYTTITGLGTAATTNATAYDASGLAATVQTNLNTHTANVSNPHSVTAVQAGALPITGGTLTGALNGTTGNFSGNLVTVTQSAGDNTTKAATTAFVTAAISSQNVLLVGPATTTKTAAYTILNTDTVVPVDTTSAAFAVTLRTAASVANKVLIIKRKNGGANAITLTPASGETIDGNTSGTIGPYGACWLLPDPSVSTNWLSLIN